MPYKRKIDNSPLFKSDEEIRESTQKANKTNREKIKNNSKITYQIEGKGSEDTKELHTIETNNKLPITKTIAIQGEIPVKMILGSPQKVRATASRIIKLGARGKIPQTLVNSLIWQLRSLVFFDQAVADLTYISRIEALEKEIKNHEKS